MKFGIKSARSLKKRFDSAPIYIEKYLRTKMISYEEKVSTNFHVNKIPKEGSQYICLSVILIDSVFKNYYKRRMKKNLEWILNKFRRM